MTATVVNTYEELLDVVKDYMGRGWTVLSCDSPKDLAVGYVAITKINDEEIDRYYLWPLVKHAHQTSIETDSEDEFMALYNKYKGYKHFYKCDDPKRLRLGFVVYDEVDDTARSFSARLTLFKNSEQLRNTINTGRLISRSI